VCAVQVLPLIILMAAGPPQQCTLTREQETLFQSLAVEINEKFSYNISAD
jgi:hypothetical protein